MFTIKARTWEAAKLDVLSRIADRAFSTYERPRSSPKKPSVRFVRFLSEWVLLLQASVREFRSCRHRIGLIRPSRFHLSGLRIGSDYHSQPRGAPLPCIRIRACSEDIQQLRSSRPWLTLVDVSMYLEGWKRGAESPSCSLCSCSKKT